MADSLDFIEFVGDLVADKSESEALRFSTVDEGPEIPTWSPKPTEDDLASAESFVRENQLDPEELQDFDLVFIESYVEIWLRPYWEAIGRRARWLSTTEELVDKMVWAGIQSEMEVSDVDAFIGYTRALAVEFEKE